MTSDLLLADFSIYGETYYGFGQDTCASCNGVGGHSSPRGNGLGFTTCLDCIDVDKCPGCLQPLALSFDQSAFGQHEYALTPIRLTMLQVLVTSFGYEDALAAMPFGGFTCLVCGWQYDPQREIDADSDTYQAYDGYDEGAIF